MNPKMPLRETPHPWMLGPYAVYARNLHVARRVYEHARAASDVVPFGTVELETGEVVDWINMNYGVVRQGHGG